MARLNKAKAIAIYKKISKIDRNTAEPLINLTERNGANETIDQSADDDQTHYNLGVAFRQMGLPDDAIGEFQKALTH